METKHHRYYVYLLIDPRDQKVFYVGKGTSNRRNKHLVRIRPTSKSPKDNLIREIYAADQLIGTEVVKTFEHEQDALDYEIVTIDKHGFDNLTNLNRGGGGDHSKLTKSTTDVVKDPLTFKQRAFVEIYTTNGNNGTQAAREAGYKGNDNQVSSMSAQNLLKPAILQEIAAAQAVARHIFNVTRETIGIEYEQARVLAEKTSQPAAMVAASVAKARLFGLNLENKQANASGNTINLILDGRSLTIAQG